MAYDRSPSDMGKKRAHPDGYSKDGHSRLSRIRHSMIQRCNNPKMQDYNRYGGRGIKVCDEWVKNPQSFYDWAYSHGYTDELTLDRIDVNGGYCPENCRWATWEVQNANRRNNHYVEYKGRKLTIAQWSRELDVGYFTIYKAIERGWPEPLCIAYYSGDLKPAPMQFKGSEKIEFYRRAYPELCERAGTYFNQEPHHIAENGIAYLSNITKFARYGISNMYLIQEEFSC